MTDDDGRPVRWAAALTGAGVELVFLLLFRDAVLGFRLPADEVPFFDSTYVGVVYEQAAAQVRQGHLPLWFHEFDCGTPLAAVWMYGLLYPGALLFAALPLGMALAWTSALHAGWGAAGMVAFLRRRGCDASGAVGGALLFALSEWFVGRTTAGHVNLLVAAAWIPWVLRFADGCVRGERRAPAWLAIAGGLGLLAGHVQVWVVVAPLVLAFAGAEAWRVPDRAAAFRRLALGGVLGLGIAAVQIALTAEFLLHASPLRENPDLVKDASAPPLVLATKLLWSWSGPDPTNGAFDYRPEYRSIAGAWAFALAAWGFVRRAPGRWLWAGFAVFGLVAAIGTRWDGTAWIQSVPPFSTGRTPARILLLTLVGTSVLAGHGISALPWSAALRRWAVAAAAALALAFGTPAVRSLSDETHRIDWSKRLPDVVRDHRIASQRSHLFWWCNVEASGLRTLRIPCYARIRHLAEFVDDPSPALGWWLDIGTDVNPTIDRHIPVPPPVTDFGPVDVRTYPAMGGAAFFGAETGGLPEDEIHRRLAGGERALFLDGAPASGRDPAGAPGVPDAATGTARVTAWLPGEIRAEAECDGPGWVLVSSAIYPGWTCTVDGAPAPIARANIAFPAVRIDAPGRHTVVLRYEPASFRIGFEITALSLAGALFLLLHRRRVAPPPDTAPPAA